MVDGSDYNKRQGRRRPLSRLLLAIAALGVGGAAALRLGQPILRERRERAEIRSTAVLLFGPGRAAEDYAGRMLPLIRDPRLPERLAAIDRAPSPAGTPLAVSLEGAMSESIARIGYLGMARLSPAELETSLDLRRELAERSSAICAGLWTGGLDTGQLAGGLRALPEDRKQAWIDLAIHATTLELHATAPPPKIERPMLARAWSGLRSRIPPADRPPFERATKAGATAAPADACLAFRTLARVSGELPPPERDALIRSITCPFLIPAS